MSLFSGYQRLDIPVDESEKPAPSKTKSKLFEGYSRLDLPNDSLSNKQDKDEKNEILKWVSREITKPAYKGLAALPDLGVSLGNLLVDGINNFAGTNIPRGKMPSDYVGEAVDYATGGYSEGEAGVVGTGVNFGSSMLGGGAITKGANGVGKLIGTEGKVISDSVSPWLGSTKVSDVGMAGAMGATTKAAENMGADPLTAAGTGIAAGASIPSMFNMVKKAGGKVYEKLPIASQQAKKFESEAYDAAKRLGIEKDLPRNTFDKSTFTNLMQTMGEHSVLTSSKLKKGDEKMALAFKNTVDSNLNKVSIKDSLENKELKKSLYDASENKLTDADVVSIKDLSKKLDDYKNEASKLDYTTDNGKKNYLNNLNKIQELIEDKRLSQLVDSSGKNISLEQFKNSSDVPVKTLINERKRLKTAADKTFKNEYIVQEKINEIRKDLASLIDDYGKTDPVFKEIRDKAQSMHGDIKNRERLDNNLGLKELTNPEKDFNIKNLTDNYLNLKKDPDFVRWIGGKENLTHWDDIVKIVHSLPDSTISMLSKNIKTLGLIAIGAETAIRPTFSKLSKIGSALGVDKAIGWYLSNTKSLEKIAQYAKNPTPENAKIVNNTFKNEFGEDINQVNSKLTKVINGLSDSDKAKLGITAIHALPEEDKKKSKLNATATFKNGTKINV
ncbi:hypothetical protein [Cysteiniphilum halobium]|uniref:hypothetical protein n=1 Tax=Cysteiniphilum halobium TaxID=2219059 RepID=UPI003F8503B7